MCSGEPASRAVTAGVCLFVPGQCHSRQLETNVCNRWLLQHILLSTKTLCSQHRCNKLMFQQLCRGLDNPRLVYEAHSWRLQGRPLKPCGEMFAPPTGVCGPGGLKDSSINSRMSSLRSKVPWIRKSPSQRSSGSSSSLASQASQQQQKQLSKLAQGGPQSGMCKSHLAGGAAQAGSFGLGASAAAGGTAAASGAASAANSSPRDLASESPGFFSYTSGHAVYSQGSCSSRLQHLLPHSSSLLSVASGSDAAALQYFDGSSPAEGPDGRRTRSWVCGQRPQLAGSRPQVEGQVRADLRLVGICQFVLVLLCYRLLRSAASETGAEAAAALMWCCPCSQHKRYITLGLR